MSKLKLTPTTNDQLKNPTLKIVQQHEPLSGEAVEPSVFPPVAPAPESEVEPPVAPQKDPNYLKVAIIGTAPSSRMLAPFHDPSWTIWACSPGNMGILPRVDAWFEIHSDLHYPENQHYGTPYLQFLRAAEFPVYAQEFYIKNGQLPKAIPYPKDKAVDEFGPYFFTSSFTWMIAKAIMDGAKEIALFGVDMASRDEYILQRPGAYYFFLECKKRGILIGAPYESDILMPPPLYGFYNSTPIGRKTIARERELKDRVGNLEKEIQQMSQQVTYLKGALEDLDYFKNIWGGAQQFPTY